MTTFASTTTAPELTSHQRCLLLSIKPRYVNKILAGTKSVELRRTAPDLEPGAPVLLYSSTPVKAIVGHATLTTVEEQTPAELWAFARDLAGVTRAEYRAYFDGADRAFGLKLADVQRAAEPVPLERMRLLGIEPPQSWRYITTDLITEFTHWMNLT